MKTHYEILGVAANADPKEIRSAYRALVRKSHPDAARTTGRGAEAPFGEITAAYAVLSRPDRRRAYDQSLSGHSPDAGNGPFRFREFKEWILSLSFFKILFSGKRVSRETPENGKDLLELPVTELIQRVIYSRNAHVRTKAVRAIFARGRPAENADLLRLLHSGADDSVKEEILNGLKTSREPEVRDAIRSAYDTEKSLRIKKLIRHYLQRDTEPA